jgi:ABC-2 type transport system permease protein
MCRVELTKQLLRVRSLIALAVLAAVPVAAGLGTASHAGGRDGSQGGLYGASPYSALNHAAASLQFVAPLLLALVVALFGSALGAADRDWGTLRYLYVQPVSPRRLIVGKWSGLTVCAALAMGCILISGVAAGLAIFGWHPFHRIGAPSLSSGTAAVRLLAGAGYLTVCVLSIGTIALCLGTWLPGPAEALGASVAFIVVGTVVDGKDWVHWLSLALPMHYWPRWTQLLDGGHQSLLAGLGAQSITIAVALTATWLVATRRDPSA